MLSFHWLVVGSLDRLYITLTLVAEDLIFCTYHITFSDHAFLKRNLEIVDKYL